MGNCKDRRMLARYAHLGDENLREAESKLTSILEERGRLSHDITGKRSKRRGLKAANEVAAHQQLNGGADGARTRDLRSDS